MSCSARRTTPSPTWRYDLSQQRLHPYTGVRPHGCRLDGELIEHIKDGNIISDGIAFGAIQVPSAGKPIIMLADRQTTGGYTKIANVISADFRILAQLKAGDRVRFEKVSITTAQEALLAQRAALRCLRGAMNR